jgi:hypothetical protein
MSFSIDRGLFLNLTLCLFLVFTLSCTKRSEPEPIARVKDKFFTTEQIDELIQDQLYENLYDVYRKRRIALEELLNKEVFELEAQERFLSTQRLLEIEVYEKAKTIDIDSFLTANAIGDQIPLMKNPLKYVPIDSGEGKDELVMVIITKLKDDLASSLKLKFGVVTYISPPQMPQKSLAGIEILPMGKLDAVASMTIVTDITCSACHDNQPLFDSLLSEYLNKVRFEIINLTDLSTLQSLLSEYAFQEGKYWEFVKLIQDGSLASDSVKLIHAYERLTAKKIDWSMAEALRVKIKDRVEKLGKIGIQTTPTILIDHRIYYGPRTVAAISSHF